MSEVQFKIVRLGTDYPGKIDDFSAARNSFLSSDKWVLFVDDDEEPTAMLLNYLGQLGPKFPYYWIRRINLHNGRYREAWNPDFAPRLVSELQLAWQSIAELYSVNPNRDRVPLSRHRPPDSKCNHQR